MSGFLAIWHLALPGVVTAMLFYLAYYAGHKQGGDSAAVVAIAMANAVAYGSMGYVFKMDHADLGSLLYDGIPRLLSSGEQIITLIVLVLALLQILALPISVLWLAKIYLVRPRVSV